MALHRRPPVWLVPTLAVATLVLASLAPAGATVAGASPPRALSLSDLTFTTPTLGWLRVSRVGQPAGALYRTTDGGARWSVVSAHVEATALAFRNRYDGVAAVPVLGSVGMCQVDLTVVTTTDGGATWGSPAPVHTQDAPSVLAFHGRRPFLLNGSCASPSATVMAPGPSAAWTAVTELGGNAIRNGFPTVVNLTPSGSFATLAYPATSTVRAPVLRGFAYEAPTRSWRAVAIDARYLPGRIVAVSFVQGKAGMVATVNGTDSAITLWSTEDGGRHWRRDLTALGQGVQADVDMVSVSVLYAAISGTSLPAGGAAIWKSTDGGLRWAEEPAPNAS